MDFQEQLHALDGLDCAGLYRVAAALQAPVDVDGRQMTLAEYLESVGAEPWTGTGDANN